MCTMRHLAAARFLVGIGILISCLRAFAADRNDWVHQCGDFSIPHLDDFRCAAFSDSLHGVMCIVDIENDQYSTAILTLHRTSDGGATWHDTTNIRDSIYYWPPPQAEHIQYLDSATVVLYGSPVGWAASTDAGKSWTRTTSYEAAAAHVSSDLHVFLFLTPFTGTLTGVNVSPDLGTTWETVSAVPSFHGNADFTGDTSRMTWRVVGPRLRLSPNRLLFVRKTAFDTINAPFFIRNTGNSDLKIDSVRVLGPEFSVEGAAATIASGDSLGLTLHFEGRGSQQVHDTLTIWSNFYYPEAQIPIDLSVETAVDERLAPAMPQLLRSVFPAPSSNEIHIEIAQGFSGHMRLTLESPIGQEIAVLFDGALGGEGQVIARATDDLPSGTYLLHLRGAGINERRPVSVLR